MKSVRMFVKISSRDFFEKDFPRTFSSLLRVILFFLFIFSFSDVFSQDFENKKISIESLIINTKYSEFGVTEYQSKIIYCSNTPNGKKEKKGKNIYGIYVYDNTSGYFKPNKPIFFSDNIKSKFNDGPACFSKDKNTVYVTRNTGKVDKRNIRQLAVYKFIGDGNKWSNPQKANFNMPGYSTAHVTLSNDGTTLIFSSNRKGGKSGLTDLWMCKKISHNKWSKPENLKTINSHYIESFPFLDNMGNLYFSSNRKGTLGRLDIFMVSNFLNGGVEVVQLPEPINSRYDDFSFNYNCDNNYGYFSSNRIGGKGRDDIYKFTISDLPEHSTSIDEYQYLAITEKSIVSDPINPDIPDNAVEYTLDYKEPEQELKIVEETTTQLNEKDYTIYSNVYKIQIYAMSAKIPDVMAINKAKEYFGEDNIFVDTHEGYQKYLIGKWDTYVEARKALLGYKKDVSEDAFIVIYSKNKRIRSIYY